MPSSWLRSQNLLFFVYCIAKFDYLTVNPVSKELWNFSILFLAIFIASTDSSASLIFGEFYKTLGPTSFAEHIVFSNVSDDVYYIIKLGIKHYISTFGF